MAHKLRSRYFEKILPTIFHNEQKLLNQIHLPKGFRDGDEISLCFRPTPKIISCTALYKCQHIHTPSKAWLAGVKGLPSFRSHGVLSPP